MKKKKWLIWMALALLLFLTGCSSQPGPSQPDGTPPPDRPETVSPNESTLPEFSGEAAQEQIIGRWVLEAEKTQSALKSHASLTDLYGTGLENGAELVLDAAGTIQYMIAINIGGQGTYQISGDTVQAQISPYTEEGTTPTELILRLEEADGVPYLVMEDQGEQIYWKKTDLPPAT